MQVEMPNRILREGILASDRVDQLTPEAEVFYRRLMSVVDDYGRFEARFIRLRSACYPLRVDRVLDTQVAAYLDECEIAGLTTRYEVGGKPYVLLLDFNQHVRAKASKYPDPPEKPPPTSVRSARNTDATHTNGTSSANARLDVDVDVDVDECENARAREKPTKRSKRTPSLKTSVPPEFSISTRVRDWAQAKGYKRMPERLEQFVSKAKSKGYTYIDWDEAFMEAVRRDWAGLDAVGGKAQKFGREV